MMKDFVPWIISFAMFVLALITLIRNGSKDKNEESSKINESLLKANIKLDQVCATTTETRTDIKSLNKDLQGLDIRVAVLERDLKTAFNKIDELKNGTSGN